jgi:hypothetical protein
MVKQLKDSGGAIIPILGYASHSGQSVVYEADAANTSTEISSSIISILASSNVFIELGNASVQASNSNSNFILASTPYDISMGGERNSTYISVRGVDAAGTLYISERE